MEANLMMKGKKKQTSDIREAFFSYREELARELGIFYEDERNKKKEKSHGNISSRMRAREKKHHRKK